MNDEKICCPKFSPEKWDEQIFNWNNKNFIKETIPTFFHIPFYPMIGRKITKMCKMMEDAKMAEADPKDVLMLFHDPSAFRSEIYLSVTGTVPNANNVNISGTFIAKTYAGAYRDVPKFIKEMNEYLKAEGKKAKDYYIHYAYCPKCAEKYGDNYMIIFAQI